MNKGRRKGDLKEGVKAEKKRPPLFIESEEQYRDLLAHPEKYTEYSGTAFDDYKLAARCTMIDLGRR